MVEIDSQKKDELKKKLVLKEKELNSLTNYLDNHILQKNIDDKNNSFLKKNISPVLNLPITESCEKFTSNSYSNFDSNSSAINNDSKLYLHIINDAKMYLKFMNKRMKKLDTSLKLDNLNYEDSVKLSHFISLSQILENIEYALLNKDFAYIILNYQKAMIIFNELNLDDKELFIGSLRKIYHKIKKFEKYEIDDANENILQKTKVEILKWNKTIIK